MSDIGAGALPAPQIKLSGSRIFFLVLTCVMVMVLEGYDIQSMGIAAPVLMPLLKLDPVQAGQIFSASQAGVVAGALFGGMVSDSWGRRNVLLPAVLIFGAFSLSTAFVHDFTTLLAARVLTGLGLGAAMPNIVGLVIDVAPAIHRVKAVSAIMGGMPLGGACVALFATLFLKTAGWQSLFYVGGILPMVLVLFIVALPNTRPVPSAETKVNGFQALFGGGRGLSTLFLWMVFFLTTSVLYMMLNWLPSLMTTRGFDLEVSHMSSLVFNLAGATGCLIVGIIVDRFGYRRVLPMAYLGFLAGICGMAFTAGVDPLVISAAATGFFLMGAQYSLNGVSPMYYPPAARGFGTGAAIAFGRLGSIMGPLMAGYILKSGIGPLHGAAGVATAMIPLVAVAGLAMWVLARQAKVLAD